jgi:hypothetical protein
MVFLGTCDLRESDQQPGRMNNDYYSSIIVSCTAERK